MAEHKKVDKLRSTEKNVLDCLRKHCCNQCIKIDGNIVIIEGIVHGKKNSNIG